MQSASSLPKHEERLLRFALAFGIVLGLICLYYFEENWRGKRVWLRTKQQLEARGAKMDWTNYIPAPVPEAENFFGAPKMQRWFSGRGGNDLSSRINWGRDSFLADYDGDAVAEVRVVQPGEKVVSADADIILEYDAALSTLMLSGENPAKTAKPKSEIIPLIVMEGVPVTEAIKHLARQAGLNYALSPKINYGRLRPDGSRSHEPTVSVRWTNLTADQALNAVLKTYNLRYVPDAKTRIGRITMGDPAGPRIYAEPAVTAQLNELIQKAIAAATNGLKGQTAATATGVDLVAGRTSPVKPVRVVVRAGSPPGTNDVVEFFPVITNTYFSWQKSHARVEVQGSNSFKVRLNPPAQVSAADYLTWSDGFEAEFNLIREALKRPYAQIGGDYRDPVAMPIPNFICVRIMAQTLSDRTKCHLLLGQPEEAWRDLSLMREMCRLMEARPTGRPMTLVATMINSAVTGLYVDTIAEGVRLQAWREPQLAAIQQQLSQINLLPMLAESFEMERASSCHLLENFTADQYRAAWYFGNSPTNLWQKLKDPAFLILKLGPRGWVYQNMTKVAQQHQRLLEGFDPARQRVSPRLLDNTTEETLARFKHFSPYTFLAGIVTPNFTRAAQNLAKNQTMANEAQIVCALERHRLARGGYPQTLDALVPQLLDKIPAELVNGQTYQYHPDGGKFALYSVGWNEKDDGGVAGPTKDGATDARKGDWVWPNSTK